MDRRKRLIDYNYFDIIEIGRSLIDYYIDKTTTDIEVSQEDIIQEDTND